MTQRLEPYRGAGAPRGSAGTQTRDDKLPFPHWCSRWQSDAPTGRRSSGETRAIIERFGKTAPFPVGLTVNDKELGPAENVGQASAAWSSAWLASCDQDDLWRLAKLHTSIRRSATWRSHSAGRRERLRHMRSPRVR